MTMCGKSLLQCAPHAEKKIGGDKIFPTAYVTLVFGITPMRFELYDLAEVEVNNDSVGVASLKAVKLYRHPNNAASIGAFIAYRMPLSRRCWEQAYEPIAVNGMTAMAISPLAPVGAQLRGAWTSKFKAAHRSLNTILTTGYNGVTAGDLRKVIWILQVDEV
jgi:hypothetical protein